MEYLLWDICCGREAKHSYVRRIGNDFGISRRSGMNTTIRLPTIMKIMNVNHGKRGVKRNIKGGVGALNLQREEKQKGKEE